jgi:hypothetical protein
MMNLIRYFFPSLYITKKKISIEEQLEHLGGYWKRWGCFLVPQSLQRRIVEKLKTKKATLIPITNKFETETEYWIDKMLKKHLDKQNFNSFYSFYGRSK